MTIAESIFLKPNLVKNQALVHPLNYHERTEHVFPRENSKVQSLLNELEIYAEEHDMKINQKKTQAIIFNNAIK